MDKDYLELRRAALSHRSDEWNDDDFDVLPDDEVVGRIFKASQHRTHAIAVDMGIQFPHQEGRLSTHR